jgi:hypothetical protein
MCNEGSNVIVVDADCLVSLGEGAGEQEALLASNVMDIGDALLSRLGSGFFFFFFFHSCLMDG